MAALAATNEQTSEVEAAQTNDEVKEEETEILNEEYCDATFIFNALQRAPFSKYYLLFDIRSTNAFNTSHIDKANHLDIGDIDDISNIKVQPIKSRTVILCCDDAEELQREQVKALQSLLMQREDIGICYILYGGFHSFHDKYPFLVRKGDVHSKQRFIKYPNEILENALFLGDGMQAVNEKVIEDLRITHIVNVTKSIKCAFSPQIEYIRVEIDDELDADLSLHFEKVVQFINDALQQKANDTEESKDENLSKDSTKMDHRVLVHCQHGVSRSASMVIAYVMFDNKWTFESARDFVKERRAKISPNESFVKQLQDFGKMNQMLDNGKSEF